MNQFIHSLKKKATVIGLFCCTAFAANAQVVAFPGALGYGANATGGRGGSVYHVTNLNDAGVGSFRDAVSQSNRIVVFDIGGYINLKTAVSVKSNITIAGQTAPGEGIGFKGGEISFANSQNIICRHIRIRPGSETASTTDDCLSFYRAKNMIVDHLSLEFAPWNNIDGVSDDWQNYPVENITVQNSIIANPTGQQFGAHTEAVNGTWSWFNNIFANSHNRNPLAKINTVFINNVLYNCSAGYTTHTSTNFKHDIVNNYFILGPASGSTDNTWYQVDKNQSIYYSGNIKDSDKDGVLNGSETTPYWYQGPGTILTAPFSPITNSINIYNTKTAYMLAASQSGTLPRDVVDSLVVNQMKTFGNGTVGTGVGTAGPDGGLYTSQMQTGLENNGYGNIAGGAKPSDTDNDGIPDYWESAYGSNLAVDDAMTLIGDGYTLLEHYINWLADPNTVTMPNQPIDIDLTKYTNEFSVANPVYSYTDVVNGDCTLLPDGHTVRYTPATDFSGMGGFSFSVSTSDGAYQNRVSVVVTAMPQISPLPVAVSTPSPTNNQSFPGMLSTSLKLNWLGGMNTNGYTVYLGTDADHLAKVADMPYTANGAYSASGLNFHTTYYWRVDAVGASDTTVGAVWSFTTGNQTNLVARYKLDEVIGNTAYDASGNQLDGLANFTPDWYPADGKLAGAVGFSQAVNPTSAIIVPASNENLFDKNSFTISLWVKIPSNTYIYANAKDCYLIHKGSFEVNTGKWYGLQLKDGKLTFAVDDGVHKNNVDVTLTGSNNIFDNTWKNIVAVRDSASNQISVYINGVKAGSVSSASTNATIGQADKPLTIGNSTENKPYRDLIDDIRLYDNALTPSEIADLYQMKDAITLPVSVVNFTASVNKNAVTLKWRTVSELNNDGFEIERSADGSYFSKLTFLPGSGNSTGVHNYQIEDTKPFEGLNYYRLVQYGRDGRRTQIAVRAISFLPGNKDFKVYPNPSSEGKIFFAIPATFQSHAFSASMLTLKGAVLKRENYTGTQNGPLVFNFGNMVQPGIYFFVIDCEGRRLIQKVFIR